MGFVRGVGSAFSKIGSAGIKAGKVGIGAGKSIGGGAASRGARIIKNNPTQVIAATAAAAGAGALVADLDGQANKATTSIGAGAVGFGAAAMSSTAGAALATGGAGVLSAGAIGAGAAYSLGKASVKGPANLNFDNMNQLKLSKTGIALVGGSAMFEGAIKAKDAFYKSRMGTHDGMARSATPSIPQELKAPTSYVDNAGATGDLVFALNNLRNGR